MKPRYLKTDYCEESGETAEERLARIQRCLNAATIVDIWIAVDKRDLAWLLERVAAP